MVKFINLFVGGYAVAQSMSNFFLQNVRLLNENGIVGCSAPYFDLPLSLTYENHINFLRDHRVASPARQAIEDVLAICNANTTIHTVGINLSYCSHDLLKIAVWVELFKEYFIDSEYRIFVYPPLPDVEIESACYLSLSRSWNISIRNYIKEQVSKVITLNEFFKKLSVIEGCSLHFHNAKGMSYNSDVHSDLLQIFNILSIDSVGLISNNNPILPFVSKEVLKFIESINLTQCKEVSETGLFWHEQSAFLERGANTSPLLSPQLRSDLWQTYLKKDKSLYEHIDPNAFFKEALEQRDIAYKNWQPFELLDEAMAMELAKSLSSDFAQRILKGASTSAHHLPKVARRCLQAVEHVHGYHKICVVDMPKVSVLTATYNHKAFIADAIESVLLQQASFPVEHIIADDGSTDGTQEIIREYANRYKSITPILHAHHVGGGENYAALYESAESKYVALCDGDDYFTDPYKLQQQYDFLEKNKTASLCFHVVRVLYEDEPERERLYPPVGELPRGVCQFYYLSDLLKCNLIQTNSVMYRWRFRGGLPDWFRSDLCPGDWYLHLLHAEIGKIGFINKVMSVYRRHKQGIYFVAEVDRLKHRSLFGMKEIEAYDVINKHFEGRYEHILKDLSNGVFADCLLYDSLRSEEEKVEPVLPKLVDLYPDFARYFLNSLKMVSKNK